MTPMLTAETLALLVREDPLADPAYATYCIEAASIIVANRAGQYGWIAITETGAADVLVTAPRLAITIAEQLAKRSYLNPDAIVAEGSIGPIGGDRTIEDFARTFELTDDEKEYLDNIALGTGGPAGGGLWVLGIQVRPAVVTYGDTIYLPDLDPRAGVWPIGTEGLDSYAYGEPV